MYTYVHTLIYIYIYQCVYICIHTYLLTSYKLLKISVIRLLKQDVSFKQRSCLYAWAESAPRSWRVRRASPTTTTTTNNNNDNNHNNSNNNVIIIQVIMQLACFAQKGFWHGRRGAGAGAAGLGGASKLHCFIFHRYIYPFLEYKISKICYVEISRYSINVVHRYNLNI